MFRLTLILLLMLPVPGFAQSDDDTADITFEDVFELRSPALNHVDSIVARFERNPGINISAACEKRAEKMIEKYRQEDMDQWRRLKNQANSYKAGWKEKNPGACGAGGPPPICPIDHWYRAGEIEAMKEFHSIQQEIFVRRYNEIRIEIQSCATRNGQPMRGKAISDNEPDGAKVQNGNDPVEKNTEPGEFRVIRMN